MRNNLISVITIVIVSGFSLSCSGVNKSKEVDARADSTLVVNADSSQELEDVADNGKSLNDIRFANFTEKDWLDNEYIRELRKYIDSFLKGNVKNEALEPYRGDIKGKFVIANLQPYLRLHTLFCSNMCNYSNTDIRITNLFINIKNIEDKVIAF